MADQIVRTSNDIGWRQFAINVVELIRWPVAFVVIVLLLRIPLTQLLDAIAAGLKG